MRVSFPGGTEISEPNATKTFVKSIEHIGLLRVRMPGLTLRKVSLVSNTQDPKYNSSQIPITGGPNVMTHSDTKQKAQLLKKISYLLPPRPYSGNHLTKVASLLQGEVCHTRSLPLLSDKQQVPDKLAVFYRKKRYGETGRG